MKSMPLQKIKCNCTSNLPMTCQPKKCSRHTGKVMDTWKTVVKIPGSAYKYLRKSKARVVDAIQKAAPAIGKEKALELFQISKSTFQTWLLEVNRHCIASYFQACSKVYPNQLTNKQGMEIKPYLNCHCFATDALKSMRAI